jgi:hypothetical protein
MRFDLFVARWEPSQACGREEGKASDRPTVAGREERWKVSLPMQQSCTGLMKLNVTRVSFFSVFVLLLSCKNFQV